METKKKTMYVQPKAEVYEMKMEGMICDSITNPEEGSRQMNDEFEYE